MSNTPRDPVALPEDIRALCAMLDIRVRPIQGYPAHTWELNLYYYIDGVLHRCERRIQTVEYDVWLENARSMCEFVESRKNAG